MAAQSAQHSKPRKANDHCRRLGRSEAEHRPQQSRNAHEGHGRITQAGWRQVAKDRPAGEKDRQCEQDRLAGPAAQLAEVPMLPPE